MGQLVGIERAQVASRIARAVQKAPDPGCALAFGPGQRWIAELTLVRRRGDQVIARWTETRSLDRTADALALRSSASFQTETGGRGQRDAEWRVTPTGTWIAAGHDGGDHWSRRDTEEDERARIVAVSDGMLQALVDAADGWAPAGDGWTVGEGPLRCAAIDEGAAFVDRFVATATTRNATLNRNADGGRTLAATWELSDGSHLVAEFQDRTATFDGPIEDPPPDRVVPIEPERSLARAQALLAKLATGGLAEVASSVPKETSVP